MRVFWQNLWEKVLSMKKSKFTEEQIAFALRQAEIGTRVTEVCRKLGISEQTFYRWKTKFPFSVKAIQIDGGSEFKDQFEEACRKLGILLFVNPPRCPEMNAGVERSNRTSRENFYEVEDLALDTAELNRQLEDWAHTYNYIRPHRALDYLTPYEYYRQWKKNQKTRVSPMP
jgi:putative transposase